MSDPANEAARRAGGGWGPALGRAALIGLACYVTTRWAAIHTPLGNGTVCLWPGNAIVLAALLLAPRRLWWLYAGVALPAELLAAGGEVPLPAALGFGLADLAEPVLAAVLIRGFSTAPFRFDDLRSLSRFAIAGPVAAAMAAALIGTGVHAALVGKSVSYVAFWRLWWFGDGVGLLIVTPLVVAWLGDAWPARGEIPARRLAEGAVLFALIVLGGDVVFETGRAQLARVPLTPLALTPLILWAAARFGLRGATSAVALLALVAVAAATGRIGPFAGLPALEAVLRMQEFLLVWAVMALVVAVFLRELEAYHERLRLRDRAIAAISEGVVITDAVRPGCPVQYVNRAFEEITGYSRDEVLGRNCRFLQGDDRGQEGIPVLREAVRLRQPARVVLRNYRKDGTPFWNELNVAPVRDERGVVTHYIGIQHDLTEIKAVETELRQAREHLAEVNQELEARVAARTLELERLNRELSVLAATDSLTGALNRRHFIDRAEQEAARSRRNHEPLSLLIFDIDHFKTVNDVHGHAVGDEVLKILVATAVGVLRASDLLGRFGGEEFVVLLPETAVDRARDAAERLRRAAAGVRVPIPTGWLRFTISVGVAGWEVGEQGFDQALKQADTALYRAKAAGRNQVAVHMSLAENAEFMDD
jgi:diguanylate cyclase (GGDEF)-like protein/PAS domain S-box-containing protein